MLAKMATLGILQIKGFRNKGYDVVTYVHEATNRIFSLNSVYFVDVVL